MVFIVYAELKSHTIGNSLGVADYSYHFVLKLFADVLKKYGQVVEVGSVTPTVDRLYKLARALGQSCVFLSFTPPHKTTKDLSCPTIPVFAWEYNTIPNESWGKDEKNNWAKELEAYPVAITHSCQTCEAVKQAVAESFPIFSIPAPVWDHFEKYYDADRPAYHEQPVRLRIKGWVIDSAASNGEIRWKDAVRGKHSILLSGVVYCSVFNPNDGRKNWEALVQAFCWAFKECSDATLVLKLTHTDPAFSLNILSTELNRLMPFSCRVVFIHGYLNKREYKNLIQASIYVVNSSFGEGQCLPLMEFMSAGRPAIAPDHSGMADYIRPANSFVVQSSDEWTHWPHDPRVLFRTFRRRIDWGNLHDSYLSSYEEAKFRKDEYGKRSAQARSDLQKHCSQQVALQQIETVVALCKQRYPEGFSGKPVSGVSLVYAAIWWVVGRVGIGAVFAVLGSEPVHRFRRYCRRMAANFIHRMRDGKARALQKIKRSL